MSELGHNAAARRDVIRGIKFDLDDVNSRIAELMEERKRIKGRIKADLGWKVSDWNAMTRLADLESEMRDQMLDTIREGFEALEVGGMVNFDDMLTGKPAEAEAEEDDEAPPPRQRRLRPAALVSQTEQIARHVLENGFNEDDLDPAEAKIN